MAKRKTPKTDKIIDLKPEKISNEHLEKVQSIVNDINRYQLSMEYMWLAVGQQQATHIYVYILIFTSVNSFCLKTNSNISVIDYIMLL